MSVRLLRAADRQAAPWKNGGGVTCEIAAEPRGADLSSFIWRVSTAIVDVGGPFSIFPGVERTLAVLRGSLALRIEGRPAVEVDAHAAPLIFAGDLSVVADAPATPVVDLNVMTRRGRCKADVSRLRLEAPHRAPAANPTLVLSRSAEVRLNGDHRLAVDDAALIEGEPFELAGPFGSEVFVIDIRSL